MVLFMDETKLAPAPIIDNLEYIGNPFQQHHFDASPLLNKPIAGASQDLEYVLKFLYSYNGSSATYNSYRRDLERLLQWSWRVAGMSVLSLRREHIESYLFFFMNPPKAWIGTSNVARFKTVNGERKVNGDWRPFVLSVSKIERRQGVEPQSKIYLVSQAAVKASFAILSSFYNFLMQEGLVESNPVVLIKQKNKFIRRDQTRARIRRISNLQWEYVIETAEQMAVANPAEHERTLFIMNCLFAMYLRISELVADERAAPMMKDFYRDQDGHWWFQVVGKGNKSRMITVSDEMLLALKRYRLSLGLPALPAMNEEMPLINKIKGKGPVTSTRQIRKLVQQCFDLSYERMITDGLVDDAEELKLATVHWLRHTGISEDVKIRPREHVRDDAGHASMATTDRYIDSDLRERHASGKKKRIKEL